LRNKLFLYDQINYDADFLVHELDEKFDVTKTKDQKDPESEILWQEGQKKLHSLSDAEAKT